jgi:hypothetical protein
MWAVGSALEGLTDPHQPVSAASELPNAAFSHIRPYRAFEKALRPRRNDKNADRLRGFRTLTAAECPARTQNERNQIPGSRFFYRTCSAPALMVAHAARRLGWTNAMLWRDCNSAAPALFAMRSA